MADLKFFVDDGAHPGRFMWPWIYFHGNAEEFVWERTKVTPPDLVQCNVPLLAVGDGIHDGTVYGEEAVIFLWTAGPLPRRGLITLKSDHEGTDHARAKFNRKAEEL